jgi:glycerol-3-phosphate acyltransferase PlsY
MQIYNIHHATVCFYVDFRRSIDLKPGPDVKLKFSTQGQLKFMILMVVSFIAAYLIGSVSSAILVSRCMGLPDPRLEGSRNPGATNVLRLGGKIAAAITLLGDVLKGLIPVVVAVSCGVDEAAIAAAGVGAFIGHLFPVYFGFQGGKGVATFIGVLYGYCWPAGVIFMLQWCLVAYLFRYSSLAALTSALLTPLVLIWWVGYESMLTLGATVMVGLLVWRHRANIRRLVAGKEPKIGVKAV